jgi:hypothetical protein
MGSWSELKDSFLEIFYLMTAVFTTIWFWIPVLFSALLYFQLWMMFFIHPVTVLVVPTILVVYMVLDEEKRVRAQYGLDQKKRKWRFHLFSLEQEERGFKWDQEKAIEQYEQIIKKKQQKDRERDS